MTPARRLVKRAFTARALEMGAAAAVGGGVVAWAARLPPEEAAIVLLLAASLADVAFAWSEERAQTRRAAGAPAGLVKLIEAEGYVEVTCAPTGKVRIGMEVWNGRCRFEEELPAGVRVVVRAVDGKTLVVERLQR